MHHLYPHIQLRHALLPDEDRGVPSVFPARIESDADKEKMIDWYTETAH